MINKLKKVVFEFDNGKKELTGKELENWEFVCSMKSDYIYPFSPTDVLGKKFGGIIMGFFPKDSETEAFGK